MTLAEVRAVVPKVLYQKHTLTGLAYVARDVLCAVALYNFGWSIDPLARSLVEDYGWPLFFGVASKWFSWVLYWYWQGIILAGWWCLAHEAGHGTLSQYNSVNHIVGYSLHTVSALISSAPQCSNPTKVSFRSLLRMEIHSSRSSQSHHVRGTRRKLCPSHASRLQSPFGIHRDPSRLSRNIRRNSDIHAPPYAPYAGCRVAVLFVLQCHGLADVSSRYQRQLDSQRVYLAF